MLLKIYSAANLVDSQPDCTGSEPYGESSREIEVEPPFCRPTPSKRDSKAPRARGSKSQRRDTQVHETEVYEADVEFCSRSEAICAELLRKFVPHFTLEPGVTFQVAIGSDCHGNTLAVDFLVDPTFRTKNCAKFPLNSL